MPTVTSKDPPIPGVVQGWVVRVVAVASVAAVAAVHVVVVLVRRGRARRGGGKPALDPAAEAGAPVVAGKAQPDDAPIVVVANAV